MTAAARNVEEAVSAWRRASPGSPATPMRKPDRVRAPGLYLAFVNSLPTMVESF